jgi:hypothetical protein
MVPLYIYERFASWFPLDFDLFSQPEYGIAPMLTRTPITWAQAQLRRHLALAARRQAMLQIFLPAPIIRNGSD